jgi:hypothetical protein
MMSRKEVARRIFLRETITTTLGAGALALLGRSGIARTLGAHTSGLASGPAREVNPNCVQSFTGPGLWRIAEPPTGTLYHGVYPGHCDDPARCDTPGEGSGEEDNVALTDLLSYSSAVGSSVPLAWVYFSNNWGHSDLFPMDTARWIREQKSVPFIRLMLRKNTDTENCQGSKAAENVYTLERINAGCFDDKLRAWGKEARTFATPLIVEWGTEVNGCWFHWNGKWHGKESGASLFRNAFRHIVRLVRDEAGAENVTWVFHATAAGDPDSSSAGNEWNRICRYYPGDYFVDWIGLSVYGADAPLTSAPCVSFETRMNRGIEELGELKTRKPLFVLEFGAPGSHLGCDAADVECQPEQCDAAKWGDDALRLLTGNHWPEVRGFSWWNEVWADETEDEGKKKKYVMNMRVQSVKRLKEVFQRRLGDRPGLLSCPTYRRVEAHSTQLKLLVPAYFSPGGAGAKHWDALVEAAHDVEVVAIANPQDGPGPKADSDYRRYIEKMVAQGATVLGYVRTNYGAVPLKKVQDDVRKWLDWYEPVGGFFFDEQWPDDKGKHGEDMISHYRTIFDDARRQLATKKKCGGLVISNPGMNCSERYLTEAGADVLCLYESPERPEVGDGKPFVNFEAPAWMKGHQPHHFAALVLQVGSVETMRNYLRKAAADGFGYAYITERPPHDPSGKHCTQCEAAKPVAASCEEECNPWNRLASYWKEEVVSVQVGMTPLSCR